MINESKKLISLLLSISITLTSLGLAGCSRNKNPYQTGEKMAIYENIEKGPTTWFCDIYVEDYNDKILEGAVLQLIDENNNVIETWTSTKEAHRLTDLEDKIYTLVEVSTPNGYVLAGNNSWQIDPDSGYRHEIIAIKNIKEEDYINNNINNILNTGKKEYINDEYFVLKIKEAYENRESKRDHLEISSKLPNYILLKGTLSDTLIPEYSNTIQYQFNDVLSDYSFDDTNVVLTYNGDGSFSILLYRTYLGIKGKLSNSNLYIVPLSDLTEEEKETLIEEHQNNKEVLDKILNYDPIVKTKQLKK